MPYRGDVPPPLRSTGFKARASRVHHCHHRIQFWLVSDRRIRVETLVILASGLLAGEIPTTFLRLISRCLMSELQRPTSISQIIFSATVTSRGWKAILQLWGRVCFRLTHAAPVVVHLASRY